MTGIYTPWIVVLSVLVAVAVSYAALSLSVRVATSRAATATRLWLGGGAVAMGIGIWAMHFIGMMAYQLPISLDYDILITLMSLAIAIGISGYALVIATAARITLGRHIQAALLLGSGIAAMHYTGMGAIAIVPGVRYEPVLLAASVAIAVLASFVALGLFFRLRRSAGWRAQVLQAAGAVVMGAAISGMHYTGMAASRFAADSFCLGGTQLNQGWLALTVAVVALGLLAIVAILLVVDSHLASRSQRHAAQLEQANEQLQYAATHDGLTGLPNRSLLAARLNQAIAQSLRQQKQCAVLLIDLDRFKAVNDSLGHLAGDELLRELSRRMLPLLRSTDTLARMGGDEFVIVLNEITGRADVEYVANKLQQAIAGSMHIAGVELQVSSSIGIALCPNDGTDATTLMMHADAAMYHGKHSGRNAWHFFEAGMGGFARERLELESALRRALTRGEFVLHYQPKVTVGTGRINGVEALIRWNHPQKGLLAPADFIAIAEETGLILPIGEWVLREACRQLREWHDAGFSRLHVSVNLSAEQFLQMNLVEMVKSCLAAAGMEAQYLELELTETAVMRDAERSARVLGQLAALDVKISVDDFGTGYSSLSYLRRLPLHKLKIDRSFIRDIVQSRDDAEIVRAIVTLAHSLRLEVTAEGVETSDQFDFIRQIGCDQYQGFLCSRPVTADDFLVTLKGSTSPTQRLRLLGSLARKALLGGIQRA